MLLLFNSYKCVKEKQAVEQNFDPHESKEKSSFQNGAPA